MGEEVKVHGSWASPFSDRVIRALKLKGINYEYIEEDLSNKSELLLNYNPIYKKIPVLVHRGKPIIESLIILQYIEDTWPDNPLLPEAPYEKAIARFWINYSDQKAISFYNFFRTSGETQAKAKEEVIEILKTLEEKFLGDKKFFGGDNVGLVDIAFGWLVDKFNIMSQLSIGTELLEPNAFPTLYAWSQNFKELPVIQETLPDKERVYDHFRRVRDRLLKDNSIVN